MDPFMPTLALVLGAAVTGAMQALRARRSLVAAWTTGLEAAGLREIHVSGIAGLMTGVSARAGPLQVRLHQGRPGGWQTRIVVSGLGHGTARLDFTSQGADSWFERMSGTSDLELGDPAFDRLVTLHGSLELACSVFDASTREVVARLVAGQTGDVSLGNATLRLVVRGPCHGPGSPVFTALRWALHAARRLQQPDDLAPRLAANMTADPLPAVRLQNLRLLVDRHPAHPATRPALTAGLADPDEEVRLRAALALGEEGRPALLEIAAAAASDDARASLAVRSLGEHLATEHALGILRQSLRLRRLQSAAACVDALGGRRGAAVVDLLATVLAGEPQELAAAAVRSLAATEEPAAEAHLVQGLQADSPEVRVAVAAALERVGTAAAVMPLLAAADRHPDGGLGRAARRAVDAIQARLQGAAPGQLSLSAADAGQVSLAGSGDAGGRVSVREEP
jgi:hypothetical protein